MRVGRRANTSIGRFLRLYLRNVAGLRIPPDATDKGSIGGTFNVALAEDEEACREFGWVTYGEMRGIAAHQNAVTLQSVVSISPPIYSAGVHAESHLIAIADLLGRSCGHWTHSGVMYGHLALVLVMSPYVAGVLARDGLSKADVAEFIHQRATIQRGKLTEFAARTGTPVGFDIDACVKAGLAPAVYADSTDDEEVPVFPWADSIYVVVAGDPARNQSRGFLGNHRQGIPTTKPLSR
jgi:hypothetical protein